MDLSFANTTCGLLLIILLLLLRYYWSVKKKVAGFPFYNIILNIAYNHVTGKIPKDVPFSRYIFQYILDIIQKHSRDGLLMVYFARPVLFIYSEDAIKFFSNEKAAVDKPPEYDIPGDVFGNGVGMRNGEEWKARRKLINPVFQLGALIDKVPLFNEHALELVRDMEKMVGEPYVDLLDALKCNYFNALSESVFGFKQMEENKAKNLRCFTLIDSLSKMTAKRLICPWYGPKFLLHFTPFGRKYLKELKEYKRFITKVINDMKDFIASSKSSDCSEIVTDDTHHFSKHLKKSFTYILLNHHFNDPSFTFQDLHDEVSTILITGYDTVTYTTLWCLFMLGLHPEVQEKVYKEVQSISKCHITYEDSCNLTYLEAIILETLRLYPAVPVFGRNLTEDVQFGKYRVYKGTSIGFTPYVSHRNPDIYPNPESFEPDRFLTAESKAAWSYIPFSVGNRICLGKKYALIEMKIFLAHILRNFKINSLDTREDVGLCWNIGLIPERPIRLKVTPRYFRE